MPRTQVRGQLFAWGDGVKVDTALQLGLRQGSWYPENLEPQCNMETVLAPPLRVPHLDHSDNLMPKQRKQ